MLICDAFTGNFAFRSNEDKRRERWGTEVNCILPVKPPGGWSAAGQPCDAFHGLFRRLCNYFTDAHLGYHVPGLERFDSPVELGVNGQKHLEISPEASIKSLVFGWQELQKYPSVMCWSWTSRGLVTDEEMQALRPEVFKDGKAIKCSSATLKELVPGIPLLLPCLARITFEVNLAFWGSNGRYRKWAPGVCSTRCFLKGWFQPLAYSQQDRRDLPSIQMDIYIYIYACILYIYILLYTLIYIIQHCLPESTLHFNIL